MEPDDLPSDFDLYVLPCYVSWKEGDEMTRKEVTDKISIYIPQSKMDQKPVERLIKLGEKGDRSINYLVVNAIIEYLDREEKSS